MKKKKIFPIWSFYGSRHHLVLCQWSSVTNGKWKKKIPEFRPKPRSVLQTLHNISLLRILVISVVHFSDSNLWLESNINFCRCEYWTEIWFPDWFFFFFLFLHLLHSNIFIRCDILTVYFLFSIFIAERYDANNLYVWWKWSTTWFSGTG